MVRKSFPFSNRWSCHGVRTVFLFIYTTSHTYIPGIIACEFYFLFLTSLIYFVYFHILSDKIGILTECSFVYIHTELIDRACVFSWTNDTLVTCICQWFNGSMSFSCNKYNKLQQGERIFTFSCSNRRCSLRCIIY